MTQGTRRRCPHDDILSCPLYYAAHLPGAPGCDDGRLAEGGCAVDRRRDYEATIKKLRVVAPHAIAWAEAHEAAALRRRQLYNNMRAAGIR